MKFLVLGAMLYMSLLNSRIVLASQLYNPCPAASTQYALTCYKPGALEKAERSFDGHPVNPTKAVARTTGLTLHRIIVGRRLLPKQSKRVILLQFDYGNVPDGSLAASTSSSSVPTWVVVVEYASRFPGLKAAQISRVQSQTGGVGGMPTAAAGNWQLRANFHGRRLSILVASDGSKAAVIGIGRELLGEGIRATLRTIPLLIFNSTDRRRQAASRPLIVDTTVITKTVS